MKREHWQKLAEERATDAKVLLDGGQWAGAYYLAGYAVECALKACILAFVEQNPDVVFRDKKYSGRRWTHDIGNLVALADLRADRDADALTNPALGVNWFRVQGWSEAARYEGKPEPEAREFYGAVTHDENGVLPWIRGRW